MSIYIHNSSGNLVQCTIVAVAPIGCPFVKDKLKQSLIQCGYDSNLHALTVRKFDSTSKCVLIYEDPNSNINNVVSVFSAACAEDPGC